MTGDIRAVTVSVVSADPSSPPPLSEFPQPRGPVCCSDDGVTGPAQPAQPSPARRPHKATRLTLSEEDGLQNFIE